MALFGKNPNETAYTGGKKHWLDVIKNSSSSDFLIWRQPEEDFNTNSTLIVMPGEEAIFIKGGQIEQVFESGTYRLSTENYPFISRLRNAFSGGISVFNCVVYFVRKSQSAEILWGTSTPIQVRDKLVGSATKIGARGAYRIQIDNPQKLLTKLMGSSIPMVGQQEFLDNYFENEFQGIIRAFLTRVLNETKNELLGIESRITEFAQVVEPLLNEAIEVYGVKMIKFSIAALTVFDDENRTRFDEIGMDALEKLRNAQADKGVMEVLGDDWGKQQAAKILGNLSNNPGAGGVAATGAGIGMGMAAGGVFAGMAQQMFEPMRSRPEQPMTNQPSGRFNQKSAGGGIGQSVENVAEDPLAALEKIKEALDRGYINQADYDAKKAEILARM